MTMRCYLFTSSCALAAVAFVAFFSHAVLVAGGDPSNKAIEVDVYYESLCPDSMRWIKDKLAPSYDALKDYIHVNYIPYGKASQKVNQENGQWQFVCQHGPNECEGNMAQACAIHAIQNEETADRVQQLTEALVVCAMASSFPATAVPQCAETVKLNQQSQDSIRDCMSGPLAQELLAANGKKTAALTPPLSFVPTITLNGVYSQENQRKALNNFFKLICDNLGETKPSQCNGA
ncbi:gamma-interferon-inducible lysosomal thiol reductase-like [Hylaeus anthracinus]|uniref:gamma-interferon-inducible lysosomal thiol reductase-like n=1 Tax=Hylaeus anthracinus TaxID=313031 RepID=UPI0023BA37F0|nr:gamma-interferon-inducible lysosomal thiol reductase-like [Hylaeus anthracinus]